MSKRTRKPLTGESGYVPTTESGKAYQRVVNLKRDATSAQRAIAKHKRALLECSTDSEAARQHRRGVEQEQRRLEELQVEILNAWEG